MASQPRPTAFVTVALARPGLGDGLSYAVPDGLASPVSVGQSVEVPLGRQREVGWVIGVSDRCDLPLERVRPIVRVVDARPQFDADQLIFFRWIADYYLAPLGAVVRTALPAEARARAVRTLQPTDAGVDAIADVAPEGLAGTVLRVLVARPGLTPRALARRYPEEGDEAAFKKACAALVRRGFAAWHDDVREGQRGRVATVALTPAGRAAVPRGTRALAVHAMLLASERAVDVQTVVATHGASARDALRRFADAGWLERDEREVRDPLDEVEAIGPSQPLPLRDAQRDALVAIASASAGQTFLLFGVTGSGKTEVFLGAAAEVIARGGQVCVLVPEIGLTPQLVGRFRARFGDAVAVLHSGLSGGERLAQWRRVRAGEAQVVVGARSALFAPFQTLGLVVVDEEHDDSYKQDDGVRYNARDLAVVLGRQRQCAVVLASATPSLESWHNAEEGRYRMLRLPERATGRPVPLIEVVDMTAVAKDEGGHRPILAPVVVDALRETFARGEQAMVLYNRRGWATLVSCDDCGGSFDCPSCGIALTLHRGAMVLACHYCGLKRPMPDRCPACGGPGLVEVGKGTERVEAVLQDLFPGVSLARLDADVASRRGALHEVLSAFRAGRTQLLVGTQMLAKGHDFPGVATAVVVSVDQGFRMPDFRAGERTFALLVQLAGRAGRGATAGRVLVQTHQPELPALRWTGDVEGFLRREARVRSTLRYPPYARLALVRLDGEDRDRVMQAARDLATTLRRGLPAGFEVLGPAMAAMPRLAGRWRVQVVLRAADAARLHAWLVRARPGLEAVARRGVHATVDVDPRHLM
jgi:primosomal protein N' (replication factor Y)